MNTTRPSSSYKDFPSLRRSYARGQREGRAEALAAIPPDGAQPEPRRVRNPAREMAGLEEKTETFRASKAWEHLGKIGEIAKREALALEEWTDVVSGESPPMKCKNATWRTGAKPNPAKIRRCTSVNDDGQRCAMLRGHEGAHRISRARVPCACSLCVLHDSLTSRIWHEGRKEGQRFRFDRVRSCGSRMMVAGCGVCGTDRRAVPEGCGVRRVCPKCDTQGAVKRRSRFGRARGRAFLAGHRYGLARRNRRGGRYSEKMLTLTLPHKALADCRGIVKKLAVGFYENDLAARVIALFEAWPRFLRKLNRHWRMAIGEHARHVVYHRAFEWTPGKSDEHGHPHYHVYLWSPFVDRLLVRAWWAEALHEVGYPVDKDDDGNPVLSTRIQMLRSNGVSEVRELMKGGNRQALTLSRVAFVKPDEGVELRRGYRKGAPGVDAFSYAEGWTLGDVAECSDDVRARLYKVLEGRRMTQASRGFFLDDDPASCEFCGASGCFRVRFDATPIAGVAPSSPIRHETGPP